MALFTDAAAVSLNDLLPFESSLAQIAASHGINVDNKISLALSALGDKLTLWLLNAGATDPLTGGMRSLGPANIVVTPPLARWLAFEALARFFAEAYNVQLNTRFQGKWNEYRSEARVASELFALSGIGVVYAPLPKPAIPLLAIQSGSLPAQSISVQTAWVDTDGNESALSALNGAVLPANSAFAVAMTEGALNVPAAAFGWNLYAGTQAEDLTKQNATPLAIGSTWTIPDVGLQIGTSPLDGQEPDAVIEISNGIRRG